ncbi:MAG: hypothetical protein ACE3JP_05540 [Ectobacillus sp.]
MNKAGQYAASSQYDEIQLMHIVFELTEKERMSMWAEGYIDFVIEKMPSYAKDILINRKQKWEDAKEYVQEQLQEIINDEEFTKKAKADRKEFALYVTKHHPRYKSLLFRVYDGNLNDADVKKYVYRNRYHTRRK